MDRERQRVTTAMTAVIVPEHRLLGEAVAYALRVQAGFRSVRIVTDASALARDGAPRAAVVLFDCTGDVRARPAGTPAVAREASMDDLLAALRRATSPAWHRRRAAVRRGELSPREHEISALIASGLSNREIARRLGIAVPTVKNHVHHLLTKLHARSRWQAAATILDGRDRGTPA